MRAADWAFAGADFGIGVFSEMSEFGFRRILQMKDHYFVLPVAEMLERRHDLVLPLIPEVGQKYDEAAASEHIVKFDPDNVKKVVDGTCAVVMEDVGGVSLDLLPREEPLSLRECLPLFVQVADAGRLGRLRVADDELRELCGDVGIDTVGVFALRDGARIQAHARVRDLCHGVGGPEEAASGTTNGALASLLWRRGLLAEADEEGHVVVVAEQGIEMGRPSRITTRLHVAGSAIDAVDVGGGASRRLEGRIRH